MCRAKRLLLHYVCSGSVSPICRVNKVRTHQKVCLSVWKKFLEQVQIASQVRAAAQVEAATMLGVATKLDVATTLVAATECEAATRLWVATLE